MEKQIESHARTFGIPSEVLDLIGRDFVLTLVQEMPVLLLPAFMSDLKHLLETYGLDWIKRNVSHLKLYFLQLRRIYGSIEATGSEMMENPIESAARQFGVPSEVLDLIDRKFISQTIEEFPSLLLPPIMETLRHEYVKNGLEWVKQNVANLQKQFIQMRELYGPTWILA